MYLKLYKLTDNNETKKIAINDYILTKKPNQRTDWV
jgi:hypothetical protein